MITPTLPSKDSHRYFGREGGSIVPKHEMYKWTTKDSPGDLIWLDKNELFVDHTYQRDKVSEKKILRLASEWSWIGCGAICVAMRDSDYMVIDGQHRVLAAKRRADISQLPCIVFETSGIEEEAQGFISANINRMPVQAIDKFRAMVVSRDPVALRVQKILDDLGITVASNPTKNRQLKTTDRCIKYAEMDEQRLRRVLAVAAELCDGVMVISHLILQGLWKLDMSCCLLTDRKFRERIIGVGADALLLGARKAAGFYGKSGELVAAKGMLTEINKNLRSKYELTTGGKEA
jgi:hypothetical protein